MLSDSSSPGSLAAGFIHDKIRDNKQFVLFFFLPMLRVIFMPIAVPLSQFIPLLTLSSLSDCSILYA